MLLQIALIYALLASGNALDGEDDIETVPVLLENMEETTDAEDDGIFAGIYRLLAYLKAGVFFSDWDFLDLFPDMSLDGDRRRFATLNLGYQLACYQGIEGYFLSQELWAMNKYNGYACYCGGGVYHGNYLDATDLCCRAHDICYSDVMDKYELETGCHTYTVPYSVSCCKDEKYTKCTDSGPGPGRELCECDQVMARCVSESSGSYDTMLFHNRSQCTVELNTKPFSAWDILKSCKHASSSAVKLPITYGSQGTCPEKKSGWFWGKR